MNNPTYYLLDVFTDEMFGGNQLALFPDAWDMDPNLFQKIALEFNLPETVFLFPPQNEGEIHSMRIFTPRAELPTAGHPTIGTAHYIATWSNIKNVIELDQKVGRIKVEVKFLENGEPDMISMYQPLPVFGNVFEQRNEIAAMLALSGEELADLPIQEVSCGNNFLLVPLKSANSLSQAKVNLTLWEKLQPVLSSAGIYVFSTNDVEGGAVKGRMFAPKIGIKEDPATGSANGPLACYLSRYTNLSFPLTSLQGFEMGRPSYLYLDITKNAENEITEVIVSGKSKLVGRGELFLNW